MKIFRYSSLAAAVMIIVTGVVFFGRTSQNTVLAFDQILENAEKATSVSLTHTQQFFGKQYVTTTYASGDWERTEGPYSTRIKNVKTGEYFNIEIKRKTITKGKTEVNPKKLRGILENSTSFIKGKNAKYLKEVELDGKTTQLYSIPTPRNKDAVFQMWVDPDTHLPIKIVCMQEAVNPDNGEKELISETEQFTWNAPINIVLSQLPEDYKVVEAPANAPKATVVRKPPKKEEKSK